MSSDVTRIIMIADCNRRSFFPDMTSAEQDPKRDWFDVERRNSA